jgi:hypothetical protein
MNQRHNNDNDILKMNGKIKGLRVSQDCLREKNLGPLQ